MKPKILFAIYSIKIRSKEFEDYISLDNGIEGIDFFQVFKSYFSEILKLPQVLETKFNDNGEEIPTKKLTLLNAETFKINEAERYIVGEFYLGTTDSTLDVINFESNEPLFSEAEKDNVGYYRRFFFYLTIPESGKIGYIVIRKVGIHGMKGDFEKGFKNWFKFKGFTEKGLVFYLRQISNIILLKKLLEKSPLQQFKIIKRTVPASPEASFKKGVEKRERKGSFEMIWKSSEGLGRKFKDIISTFMNGEKESKVIELGTDISQEFDELEYNLELNGKEKKFSLYKETKMRSDRDVTNDIEYHRQSNKPTVDSLIAVAKEMVEDFSIKE